MTASPATLAQRRAQLLTTIAGERAMMAASLQVWRQPLAVLDVARSAAQFVRLHPIAVTLACAALRLILPRRLLGFSRGWRTGRRLAAALGAI